MSLELNIDHAHTSQDLQVDSSTTDMSEETSRENAVMSTSSKDNASSLFNARQQSERQKKLGHRRVATSGEVTYKKIQTSQIIKSIQLGIQHAVGGLASKPERDLLMQDFMTVETTTFTSDGRNLTPAHHFPEFVFKTYAPIAFRYFRDLFGIQPDDFLLSLCSTPLRELSNPGASGSIFYVTADDEFILKTIQHKEGEFLQKLLPGYYMNLNQNPRTLLPKFFGLYCYQCNSKNIRIVVMNNILPSSVIIHQKYDLKGSTYKRKASKSEREKKSPTYKDLDFMEHHPEGIYLESETYNAFVKTIQRDCRVLESFQIMDYSLLVGIHNANEAIIDQENKSIAKKVTSSTDNLTANTCGDSLLQQPQASSSNVNRSRSINRQRLVAHSTAMESIQAESEMANEEVNAPTGGIPAKSAKDERLFLFLGIIDILQSYRLKKKLEHTWKSILHNGDTVSVHRPGFYAERFQNFMDNVVFKKIQSPLKYSPVKRRSIPVSRVRTSVMTVISNSGVCNSDGFNASYPSSSTPPPSFDEAIQDLNVELPDRNNRLFSSQLKQGISTSSQKTKTNEKEDIVIVDHKFNTNNTICEEGFTNLSESRLSSRIGNRSVMTIDSECSTSGIESVITGEHIKWTSPLSIDGSTPTSKPTDGNLSFTDSSSSDELCSMTPEHDIYHNNELEKNNENISECTEMTHL